MQSNRIAHVAPLRNVVVQLQAIGLMCICSRRSWIDRFMANCQQKSTQCSPTPYPTQTNLLRTYKYTLKVENTHIEQSKLFNCVGQGHQHTHYQPIILNRQKTSDRESRNCQKTNELRSRKKNSSSLLQSQSSCRLTGFDSTPARLF